MKNEESIHTWLNAGTSFPSFTFLFTLWNMKKKLYTDIHLNLKYFHIFFEALYKITRDFLLFLEPLLPAPGSHSPHTLQTMTDPCVLQVSPPLTLQPPPPPTILYPHSHHFPLGNKSRDGRKDGWCYFELWHVSMQVIPLLFINNWPAPSVEAIYRADCCFDKECKLLERALVYTAEGSVFIKLLTSCWFSFALKHRSDITAGVNV